MAQVSYLLDTNIVSEPLAATPNPAVLEFNSSIQPQKSRHEGGDFVDLVLNTKCGFLMIHKPHVSP